MILAGIKALLYLGTIFLVGAAVFLFYADALKELISRTRLRRFALLGGSLLLLASPLELINLFINFLGYVTPAMLWDYIVETGHGRAVGFRLALSFICLLLIYWRTEQKRQRWVLGGVSLGLLATFSVSSHGAAVGGSVFMLTDLIHFSAAALWGGLLVYLALSQNWQNAAAFSGFKTAIAKLSKLGLISVATLFITGIYTSLAYMSEPQSFSRSPYGLALYGKLVLVMTIVAIAAINRFKLLPELRDHQGLQVIKGAIRLEVVLLLTVFIVTGLLTTSELPHYESTTVLSAGQNLVKLLEPLFK